MKICLLISSCPTEAGSRDNFPASGNAPPDYLRANVAGLLVGSAQTAICHIPTYTSKFFDKQTSLPVGRMLLPDRSRAAPSKFTAFFWFSLCKY